MMLLKVSCEVRTVRMPAYINMYGIGDDNDECGNSDNDYDAEIHRP